MLAHIVDERLATNELYPWEYPRADDLPPQIREWLYHAQNFAEAIHGAALLYNLMLAQASDRNELVDKYGYALDEWTSDVNASRARFDGWDRGRFWELTSPPAALVKRPTQLFIDRWLDIALAPSTALHTDRDARNLIEHRELALKKSQARLSNLRALERWTGAAGTAQLNYRWPIAQRISNDIVNALNGSSDA